MDCINKFACPQLSDGVSQWGASAGKWKEEEEWGQCAYSQLCPLVPEDWLQPSTKDLSTIRAEGPFYNTFSVSRFPLHLCALSGLRVIYMISRGFSPSFLHFINSPFTKLNLNYPHLNAPSIYCQDPNWWNYMWIDKHRRARNIHKKGYQWLTLEH